MRSRFVHPALGVGAQATALGAWLVTPSTSWAVAALLVGALGAAAAWRLRRLPLLGTALVGLTGSGIAFQASREVRAVEDDWERVHEELIQRASQRLDATLSDAVSMARELADRGAEASSEPAPMFRVLRDAIDSTDPERGVAVLDTTGVFRAWAGRHRVRPETGSRELSVNISPFYVVLEARRQAGEHVAVGQVLLAAHSAIPDREGSVAAAFERATRSALEFYPPGTAPVEADVFDYCIPSCSGSNPDTLFSVRALAPSQGRYKLDLLDAGGRRVAILAGLSAMLLLAVGGLFGKVLGVVVLPGLVMLTPAGTRVGLDTLFSSATFYSPTLGPVSASSGALITAGALATAAAALWWHRPRISRTLAWSLAGSLVTLTPLALRALAQGITPPVTGASAFLWLGWQTSLAAACASSILFAGALVRASGVGVSRRAPGIVAALWSLALGALSLSLWEPGNPWPIWYSLVWVPALALAVLPTARTQAVVTSAVVAGTLAAALTWSTVLERRIDQAGADADRLGDGRDPIAVGLLSRLGSGLVAEEPPMTQSDLYARWQGTMLSREGYPAVLATWGPDGGLVVRLDLAELDLPAPLLRSLAASAAARGAPTVEELTRVSGVHPVLAQPVARGFVVTVGVGPRSRLYPPLRLSRFLRGDDASAVPYTVGLSEPVLGHAGPSRIEWVREGWEARGERHLDLPGGTRHLHVTVSLGGWAPLLVRGALMILANLVFVAFLVVGAEQVRGGVQLKGRLGSVLGTRSYRTRLAAALAVFFVVPTLGFAVLAAGRLRTDARRERDIAIQQSLRDASGAAQRFGVGPGLTAGERLVELGDRLGTDLLLYENGVLRHASAPVLSQLGLVDMFLPGHIYQELAVDEALELVADTDIGGRPTRVGYRTIRADMTSAVLAAPSFTPGVPVLGGQGDLAYALLLVTLGGLGAALGLASVAARALATPVQRLRAAAAAVGRGEPLPVHGDPVPDEFVPVTEAFERMSSDVRASQAAVEAARRRTAAVLRNIATGVVALDGELHVTMANPRAEEVFGVSIEPGVQARAVTSGDWRAVWDWVAGFLNSGGDVAEQEVTIGGRRIRVQASALGADAGGVVVALDDITEFARAVRVLAWGEMAQQVAHEIKNPLTPIRLGVQHLLRAHRDGRGDFRATLDRTTRQILAEIERLNAIARAFGRFGAPSIDAGPLDVLNLAVLAEETITLYSLGGGAQVRVEAEASVEARVRKDEFKEVLVNLIENARTAGARTVTIGVLRDAGGAPGSPSPTMAGVSERRISLTSLSRGSRQRPVEPVLDWRSADDS